MVKLGLLVISGADVTGVIDCDTFYPFFGSYNLAGWLAKTLGTFLYSSSMQSTGYMYSSLFSSFIYMFTLHRVAMLSHYHVLNSSYKLLHTKEGRYFVITCLGISIIISNIGIYVIISVSINVSDHLVEYVIVKPRHHR